MIQLLQERYWNTQVLINAYMKKFVAILPVKNDRDVGGLRKLYDEVETSVRISTINLMDKNNHVFTSRNKLF